MYASLSSIIQVAITNERTFERSGQPRYSFPDVTLSPNICDEDGAERVPERSSEGTSEFAGVARAYAVFRDLNIVIALRNCMFSGDQSDVQEFFLYVMEEISKEVESLSLNPAAEESNGEWEEVGKHGRKLHLTKSMMETSLINSLFEIQLRKIVAMSVEMNRRLQQTQSGNT